MDIKTFLHDYGPAVGPALAFLFAALALVVKYFVENLTSRWAAARQLQKIRELIYASPPPAFDGVGSHGTIVSAKAVQGGWDLVSYHNHLIAIQSCIASIEAKISEHGAIDTIARAHQIKWALRNLVGCIEEIRTTKLAERTIEQLSAVRPAWDNLVRTCQGKWPYVYKGMEEPAPSLTSGSRGRLRLRRSRPLT